jgi:hypothetical protein
LAVANHLPVFRGSRIHAPALPEPTFYLDSFFPGSVVLPLLVRAVARWLYVHNGGKKSGRKASSHRAQ